MSGDNPVDRPNGDDDNERPEQSKGGDENNPFAAMFGGASTEQFAQMLQGFAQAMSSPSSGPVNWDLAKQTARQTVSAAGDSSVLDRDKRELADAIRLADHWLDDVSSLPAGCSKVEAWSKAEWVEATLPTWSRLCDPVVARMAEGMAAAIPEEMRQSAGPLLGMVRQMGGVMFGSQVGQAVGGLAGEVLGASDIGLPLASPGTAALLPANVRAFGGGLGLSEDDVRLYLALREAAHQRLFVHAPWLPARLLGAVEEYAKGIDVDTSRLESLVGQLDLTNPEALQNALSEGLFDGDEIANTPAQQAALRRLETLLALVEGWVDTVVTAATDGRMPSALSLAEAVRRRRATGGPAERTLATLVGLELRPRRMREAADLWKRLTDARGVEGRDALWAHPDLLPDADDLENPEPFITGASELAEFSDLSQLGWDTSDPPVEGTPDDNAPEANGPDSPGNDDAGPADGESPDGPDGPDGGEPGTDRP
ncbi:MAG: hydrolase [Streptosporangiales bacterium]|nr:hydrolase [Streptosporangiales bacterium]